MAGQGKLEIGVVTDNALLKPQFESSELGGQQPVTAAVSGQVAGGFKVGELDAAIPTILKFPDFKPSILASFVVGTTAAQSGNTVTVTATAHLIVGSAAKNGWRIYWPGSPSIAAGWYDNFAYVDANTITFYNPVSQTVASESMNAGAIFVAQVTIASITIPGGAMGSNGRITARYVRAGDNTAGNKISRMLFAGYQMTSNGATTSGCITAQMTIVNRSASLQTSTNSYDAAAGSGYSASGIDTSTDKVVSFTMQVSNASQWLTVDYLELEIVKK